MLNDVKVKIFFITILLGILLYKIGTLDDF